MKNIQNKLDRSALKFNQGAIVIFTALAFLLNNSWITAFVAAVMLIGTIYPKAGLFKLIYLRILKPLGLIKPDIVEEDNSPHQFAQGLGGVFLLFSFLFTNILGLLSLGWLLDIIVLALAFINLTVNFCLGCFIYFQLIKLGMFKSTSAAGERNV